MVALEAVVLGPNNTKVEVPLFCQATERIIVRVSSFYSERENLISIFRLRTRVCLNQSKRLHGVSRVAVTRFVQKTNFIGFFSQILSLKFV